MAELLINSRSTVVAEITVEERGDVCSARPDGSVYGRYESREIWLRDRWQFSPAEWRRAWELRNTLNAAKEQHNHDKDISVLTYIRDLMMATAVSEGIVEAYECTGRSRHLVVDEQRSRISVRNSPLFEHPFVLVKATGVEVEEIKELAQRLPGPKVVTPDGEEFDSKDARRAYRLKIDDVPITRKTMLDPYTVTADWSNLEEYVLHNRTLVDRKTERLRRAVRR